MKINILPAPELKSLEPLTCLRGAGELPAGRGNFHGALAERLGGPASSSPDSLTLTAAGNFWPSAELAAKLASSKTETAVLSPDGERAAWVSSDGSFPEGAPSETFGKGSFLLVYPWDILAVSEDLLSGMKEDKILGTVRERVTIDGHLELGKGSVILPGVYMEGNVIIGENCKIGPNCYIRGSTVIGDGCHIGQAVEIKNSVLMKKVSIGHLSYAGDCVICPGVNFGAGTITANFRHDGKNHRSVVLGKLMDTGRRKFGSVIGDNVHTGIHTSIYPGRKIWPGLSTLPGDIVRRDLMPGP
jgi:acetyltransferase-like isoleucine patch superfamily enzyme